MDVRKMVLEESNRFRKALPELLKTLEGRWVVFKDGEVKSDYTTEDEAYKAGLQKYGRTGGQIVVQVLAEPVPPITAGIFYGIA